MNQEIIICDHKHKHVALHRLAIIGFHNQGWWN